MMRGEGGTELGLFGSNIVNFHLVSVGRNTKKYRPQSSTSWPRSPPPTGQHAAAAAAASGAVGNGTRPPTAASTASAAAAAMAALATPLASPITASERTLRHIHRWGIPTLLATAAGTAGPAAAWSRPTAAAAAAWAFGNGSSEFDWFRKEELSIFFWYFQKFVTVTMPVVAGAVKCSQFTAQLYPFTGLPDKIKKNYLSVKEHLFHFVSFRQRALSWCILRCTFCPPPSTLASGFSSPIFLAIFFLPVLLYYH